MRFLVDECTGPGVARWLQNQGHDVLSIYNYSPGLSDEKIIEKAWLDDRIIITNDKDFGEKIFREGFSNKGIILLRLDDERSNNKIKALERVLSIYSNRLIDHFIVVTDTKIRLTKNP
jgi:predicted nuclease of predicted toxin-antitoxin system